MKEEEQRFDMPLLGEALFQGRDPAGRFILSGNIPAELELFRDHFPGFPVLPGVVALEILKNAVDFFYRQPLGTAGRTGCRLKEISRVKFALFLRPGDRWRASLESVRPGEGKAIWKGRLFQGERTAVSAQLTYSCQGG